MPLAHRPPSTHDLTHDPIEDRPEKIVHEGGQLSIWLQRGMTEIGFLDELPA